SATSSADQFRYEAVPVVSGIMPSGGPESGGVPVTITGTSFTGATAVYFGTVAASRFTIDSDTGITATSPTGGLGTVDVTVVTGLGTSATSSADRFTYIRQPTVTTFVGSNGLNGPHG